MSAADFDSLAVVAAQLRRFAEERDWQQFHTPKNLAMALAGEAGEVLEHFQWLTAEQSGALSEQQRDEVALEIADVLFYLLRLADRLDISVAEAAQRKLGINQQRYPAERVRGSAKKYAQYPDVGSE